MVSTVKHSKSASSFLQWNKGRKYQTDVRALTRTLSALPNSYEIIFVNDGSSDGTEMLSTPLRD